MSIDIQREYESVIAADEFLFHIQAKPFKQIQWENYLNQNHFKIKTIKILK